MTPLLVPRADAGPLGELLAARIRESGPISFAEFMRESLYHPAHGYYSRGDARRQSDYYTSVDVHPIFGRLIARQLTEMWKLLGSPEPFLAVEAGAGLGRLGEQILDFAAAKLPAFYAALRYVAVERSPARRAAHAERLFRHAAAGHFESAAELVPTISAGCIFSNELLDALPVHRVTVQSGVLREIYVGWRDGGLVEVTGKLSAAALGEYFAAQGVRLREGQQAEVGLDACDWIERAGAALANGFVMSIDYGCLARDLYGDGHNRGTLLAYRNHRASENVLDAPGQQDLTAHVNFTALEVWGRRSGLLPAGLVTQSRFLLALGRENELADLYNEGQSELERLQARLALKHLIQPEGLGEKFLVFIQYKEINAPRLTGLSGL